MVLATMGGREREIMYWLAHTKKLFDDIQVPLSEIFEALFEYKYLKPLDFTTQVS